MEYLVQSFHDWKLGLAAHPPYSELYPHFKEIMSLTHLYHIEYGTGTGYVYTNLGRLPESCLALLPRMVALAAMDGPSFSSILAVGEQPLIYTNLLFNTFAYREFHRDYVNTMGTICTHSLFRPFFQVMVPLIPNLMPTLVLLHQLDPHMFGGANPQEELVHFINRLLYQHWMVGGREAFVTKILAPEAHIQDILDFFVQCYEWMFPPIPPGTPDISEEEEESSLPK